MELTEQQIICLNKACKIMSQCKIGTFLDEMYFSIQSLWDTMSLLQEDNVICGKRIITKEDEDVKYCDIETGKIPISGWCVQIFKNNSIIRTSIDVVNTQDDILRISNGQTIKEGSVIYWFVF